MQKKKLIITLIYAVLSIFMITACSDSNNGSNNSGNNGGDGSVLPEPKPDPNAVKAFYNFTTWNNTLRLWQDSLYAILDNGSLYAWGNNKDGQLGLGLTDEYVAYNKKVDIPGKVKLIKCAGDNPTESACYVITEDGALYVWGKNSYGQLGVGNEVNKNTPIKVTAINGKVMELIIGNYFSVYAILEDGSLYAWGNNESGKLGVGDEVNKNTPTKVNLPGKIKELITTNGSSVYALMEDSSLYSWGKNSYGQLGVGDKINKNTPTIVNLPGKIKKLITSYSASYAILEDGSLYSWGENNSGELGVGSNEDKNTPTKVTAINGKIMDLIINSDKNYTCESIFAILEDGSLYAWGNNKGGQLGIGSREDNINSPTKVTDINGKVTKVMTFIYVYEQIFSTYVDASTYILTESSSLYTTNGGDTFSQILFN